MSPEYIAFQGGFELIDAAWSLKTGRTVTFRITGEAFGRNHPFKTFQQRRAGRVGTRFTISCARERTGECLEPMEGMLMAWKDSSSIGQTVSFWLDQDAALHPFAGCAYRNGADVGDIFAVAIVELSDDDKPVRQPIDARPAQNQIVAEHAGLPPAAHSEPSQPPAGDRRSAGAEGRPGCSASGGASAGRNRGAPAKPRRLSSFAHLTATNSYFVRYLEETKPNIVATWTPEIARRYVKSVLQVESLSDLDRDAAAAARFENLIRKPYARWRYQYPE